MDDFVQIFIPDMDMEVESGELPQVPRVTLGTLRHISGPPFLHG